VTSRATTILFGPSHWHFPLYADRIAARHDVVGFSDSNETFARGLPTLRDTPFFADWRDLLEAHASAELAYVFSPHAEMAEICRALVARGIPIVVEKPAGISRQELSALREAAESANVPVIAALVLRDGPVERLLSKAGPALYDSVQFIVGPPSRYLHNGSPWMLQGARSGGGCTVNLAPHFVDSFLRSAGTDSVSVTSAMSASLHGQSIEDFASLTLTTPDGRIGTVQVGYAFPSSDLKRYSSWVRVGADGTASIATDGTASFTSAAGATEEARLVVDSDPRYGPFVDLVADGLDRGLSGLPGIRELESVMTVIWDAYDVAGRSKAIEPGAAS
jgi:predicted dehydrogenase